MLNVTKYILVSSFVIILISFISPWIYTISRSNEPQGEIENLALNLSSEMHLIFYDGFEDASLDDWIVALQPGSIAEVSRSISYSGSYSLHTYAWYYEWRSHAKIWKLIDCEEQTPLRGKLLEIKLYFSGLIDKPIMLLGMGDGTCHKEFGPNWGTIALIYVDRCLNLRLKTGALYENHNGEDINIGPFNRIFTSRIWHTVTLIYLPKENKIYFALDGNILGVASTKGLRLDGRVGRIGPIGDTAPNIHVYVDDVFLYELL